MADQYDLIVIGAGSGGVSAAPFAAQLNAKVALVEKFKPGGDCLYTGCVPSKTLIRAARAAWDVRHADEFGITLTAERVNMERVNAHIQEVIQRVYQFENPHALEEEGVEVLLGSARFLDANTVNVSNGKTLHGKRVLICTGARPVRPKIEGLDQVPYITYENVFSLPELPEHLMVIGAGPIGLELAQAYLRLGSRVTVFAPSDRILGRADPEISQVLTDALMSEGLNFHMGRQIERVETDGNGTITVHAGDATQGDVLLVATGRRPNVEGLDLEKAGVTYTGKGIPVNDQLQTSQQHIYACGDVVGGEQFTHYAAWQGYMAVRNALLPGHTKGKTDRVPWTIFTEPEVARVGLSEAEAREKHGHDVKVYFLSMDRVDRAQTENDQRGFIKVVINGRGDILGAHIVAARAGEMIHEYVLAMEHGLKLGDLARPIHVYPTYSTGNQQVAANFRVASVLQSTTGKLATAVGRWIR